MVLPLTVVDADYLAIDLVIQTACGVLTGRFGSREAVTLLASQAPQARARAVVLAERDPQWSIAHAELLRSIGTELETRVAVSGEARDTRSVLVELARVAEALAPSHQPGG